MAQRFLNGGGCHAAITLGPNNVLATIRDLESKVRVPARVVTDSLECLKKVRGSSDYSQRQVVFCGEDKNQEAKGRAVCISPESNLMEIRHELERLAQGLTHRGHDGNGPSRLRRE